MSVTRMFLLLKAFFQNRKSIEHAATYLIDMDTLTALGRRLGYNTQDEHDAERYTGIIYRYFYEHDGIRAYKKIGGETSDLDAAAFVMSFCSANMVHDEQNGRLIAYPDDDRTKLAVTMVETWIDNEKRRKL